MNTVLGELYILIDQKFDGELYRKEVRVSFFFK